MKVNLFVEELDGVWIMEVSKPMSGFSDLLLGGLGKAKRRAFPTKEMMLDAMPEMLETAFAEARASENEGAKR